MHPEVIHSTKWKHTPVKCSNNTSRLINQAQMRKKFPRGFGKTNNIISRLLFSQQKSLPQTAQQPACRQFKTLLLDLIWLMRLGIFHFNRHCLLNLYNQCELCLRPLHVCRRACSVLFAGACRERWLFPDTMIASLAAS